MIVFLDTRVLGLVSSPSNTGEAKECKEWLYRLLSRSAYMVTSDICDYEVRRSLLLASSTNPTIQGLKNLDEFQRVIDFLPLTKSVMKQAAQLWAEARRQGLQTSDNKNIDADIIIAAHWRILKEEYPGRAIVITTTNVKHLERFTEAVEWKSINF
ncbi:MAG: type II toxin-antitoxin system VapC family toxin [Rhizonema sp. NSF051]|nr:type II toxin-antitoxin system VapC family toxin [Rhizonema sp. NSF051]